MSAEKIVVVLSSMEKIYHRENLLKSSLKYDLFWLPILKFSEYETTTGLPNNRLVVILELFIEIVSCQPTHVPDRNS